MNWSLNPNENIRIEEAYQRIEEAIEQHQKSILALKSQRNDLAYISRLPPEILSRIFSFTQQTSLVWSQSLDWIKLTHVCCHWRNVAISSPELWIYLPLGNLRWLEESLERSKLAGLVVIGSRYSSEKAMSGFMCALTHAVRIRHLSMSLDSATWKNMEKMLLKSAPQLEYLSLEGLTQETYYTASGRRPLKDDLYLSDEVLCDVNRLRHLELAKCRINWDSPLCLLHSLTHLTLKNLAETSKPTGKQFVDAMKRMPDLEVLKLEDALPLEETSWTSNCIHFACLQSLVLKNSTHIAAGIFFRCFTLPPIAVLTVDCYLKEPLHSGTDFSTVIFGLSRSYLPKLSDSHFQTFILLHPTNNLSRVHIRLFRDVLGDDQMLDHSLVTAALELQFYFLNGASELGIRKLFDTIFDSAIPLQDIQSIHLGEIGEMYKPDMLASKFGRLPRIHSVVTGKYSSRLFFEALKFSSNFEDVGFIVPVEELSFPKLSSIYIHDTKFKDPNASYSCDWPTVLSFHLLQDCLTNRHEIGAAIHKLTLKTCHELPDDIVTLLKGIVADIQIVSDPEEKEDIQQSNDSDIEEESEDEEEDFEEEYEEETEGEED